MRGQRLVGSRGVRVWCVWCMFGVVVVECVILFCTNGMYALYGLCVCVLHWCGECGVCLVWVVYRRWMCLSVCSRCGICVGILLYMPCVYAPPMMYVCMPPMYGVCVLYVLPGVVLACGRQVENV